MKKIYFTVTNDLNYDQRMHRICGSLVSEGFEVVLIGRQLSSSLPLERKAFHQLRLNCFFRKGFAFYAEYNLRLFLFFLPKKMDAICAIDLDTILPCLLISKLKRVKRIYDAHEYFTELKEVRTRPRVKMVWTWIERLCVPRFKKGYTVSEGLAQAFQHKYGVDYEIIRNLPLLKPLNPVQRNEKFLLFQGAVNEARGFEYLIPAMRHIPYRLVICGDGNFMRTLKELIHHYGMGDKIQLKGMVLPRDLLPIAQKASLGIGLAEKEGINQFHALPNKFLEYMHAGLPQIAMNFPEYQKINDQFRIAILLDALSEEHVAETIKMVINNDSLLEEMHQNALRARTVYCWQREEQQLIRFYQKVFDE